MEAAEIGNGGAVEAQEGPGGAPESDPTGGEPEQPAGEPTEAPVSAFANIEAGLAARDGEEPPAPEAGEGEEPAADPEPEGAAPAATDAEAAAQALAEELRKLPGVVPQVIRGSTVEEVRGSLQLAREAYEAVRSDVEREAAEHVPGARSGVGPEPLPSTAFGKIEAGLAAHDRSGSRNGYAADTDFRTGKVRK